MDVKDVQPAARGSTQGHEIVWSPELSILLLSHDGSRAALQCEEDAVRSGVDDFTHVGRKVLGNDGQCLMDNDRVLSQIGKKQLAVARRVHCFCQWAEHR